MVAAIGNSTIDSESDGMAAAQRTLRHKDPETTAKQYDHVEAGDLAETVEDALDR